MAYGRPYFGIDLGTTNTVIAQAMKTRTDLVQADIVRINQLDRYKNYTHLNNLPSVMYIYPNKGDIIVGEFAKHLKAQQPDNVIYNSKRFMGCKHYWDINNMRYRPLDVASEILKVCKVAIEKFLNNRDKYNVTITIPASFNTDQTQDTMYAAKKAGFIIEGDDKNVETIHEPTAALIDYINDEVNRHEDYRRIDLSNTNRIMVYDLGGGTCDVCIVDVSFDALTNKLDVIELAVGRYDDFGGLDFDTWCANYLLNQFLRDYKIKTDEIDEHTFRKMTNSLIDFSEAAKNNISEMYEKRVNDSNLENIDDISYGFNLFEFYKDISHKVSITKKLYDEITVELYSSPDKKVFNQKELKKYKNIESPILHTLGENDIDIESIDYVFMTGGMSKYVVIQEKIREITKKPVLFPYDPMSNVAKGAAIYGFYVCTSKRPTSKPLLRVHDNNMLNERDIIRTSFEISKIMAESIMIDVSDGLPEVIIERKQKIPHSGIIKGKLKNSSPSAIKIDIYAGRDPFDSEMRIQKSYIGDFDLPVRTGTPLDIEYIIDKNKLLKMKVIVNDELRQEINVSCEVDVSIER